MAYIADSECFAQMMTTRKKLYEYNNAPSWTESGLKQMDAILRDILGKAGKNLSVFQPFRCDYGFNIEVGDNFFANYNFTVLDVAKVTIGDNVFIAPNVSVYTAGHPVHPNARNTMYEYGIAVSIGDNCWIGGNVTICPGVHIGSGTVIGAGSVVTKDVPSGVIAAGNPCRVIRQITDSDMEYYFKDRRFDSEAMNAVKAYSEARKS
jgi:acetyltransferase-like isoleucine patch superfamily enzyme